LKNFKDFKLNYYVQHRNSKNNEICKQGYHFVGNDQFSWVFVGPDDQKCFQRVLLRFVVWGSEKLFLGVLTKNNFFLKISHNGEHVKNSKKISKTSDLLMGLSIKG